MKNFGVALLAILAVNSAFGENWVKLDKSSNGKYTHFIDTESIAKIASNYPITSNPLISYFIRRNYLKPQKTYGGKYYDYDIWQFRGDCLKNQYVIMGFVEYTKDSSSVFKWTFDNHDWDIAQPNTAIENQLNIACKIAGYR